MRLIIILGTTLLALENLAAACGCLAPPDPTVPVVQAGERIAFAVDNGQVTANIQIQYQGPAQDFGWLLPLPAEPTLELGSDELFSKLDNVTAPHYQLTRVADGKCQYYGEASDLGLAFAGDGGLPGGPASPLVYQSTIGPYDYAVLKADSKDPMLTWLADNHYFVPAGTDGAVDPYVHPGAFFLALKLHSGASVGDLQPVVVHYMSDLPMIPIILTSVGAKPNMGIWVWILGDARAIPRNYYHTVLNDAVIDWDSFSNYQSVVTQAVSEAPAKHSFVTEYAGSSSVMQNSLYYSGRFGTLADLEATPNVDSFLEYLRDHDYPYTSQLLNILQTYFPEPAAFVTQGISPGQFYYNLTLYRLQQPDSFVGWAPNFVPVEIGDLINTRVIQPTIAVSALFDTHTYLTRLFTTLSPEDMTADPVFSFNRTMPPVSNYHKATLTYHCGNATYVSYNTPATLVTESGWTVEYANGFNSPPTSANLPAAQRTEMTGDDGVTVVSEHDPPQANLSNGCDMAPSQTGAVGGFLLLALAAMVMLLRRQARW